MKPTKTIRVSEETYQQLLAYKAELEIENRQPLSFDAAIDMLFGECAGLEYDAASERLARRQAESETAACR